jgi:predicted nucleic acid-binding protein
MSKVFIDTNILIYSIDGKDKKKQTLARTLLRKLIKTSAGVISTQVIQEFYVVATTRLKLNPRTAKRMASILRDFEVVKIDENIINEAMDISALDQISFWDSLIISSATSANCENIYTEDLNHSQSINGITIINPFT